MRHVYVLMISGVPGEMIFPKAGDALEVIEKATRITFPKAIKKKVKKGIHLDLIVDISVTEQRRFLMVRNTVH